MAIPSDADNTAIAQIVIEQRSEPFSRSVVVTTYDTDDIDSGPSSQALVVPDRGNPQTIFNLVGVAGDCPPEQPANKCLLWIGNTALQPDQFLNVRTGLAFRLCIKRGIRTTIAELLSLSDEQIPTQLQSAIIWGQIFRRPNVEGFPADPFANNNPLPLHLPVRNPTFPLGRGSDVDVDAWRSSVQATFDEHAFVEHREEGPVMYVLVWYVNALTHFRCSHPRVARLDADANWWRQSFVDLWAPEFIRGISIQVHLVTPTPPSEAWRFHAANVILSQVLIRLQC